MRIWFTNVAYLSMLSLSRSLFVGRSSSVQFCTFADSDVNLSAEQALNLIEDNKQATSNIKNHRGENVDIGPGINTGLGTEKLLYVDQDIIVVDKPPNAQTAPGFHDKDSLASRIALLYNIDRIDKMIVHRLDYATSGVVVFARNDDALRNLHEQFRKQRTRKIYTAIVGGVISASLEGEIDLYQGRDMERGPPYNTIVSPDLPRAKRSQTYWQTQEVCSSRYDTLITPYAFPLYVYIYYIYIYYAIH